MPSAPKQYTGFGLKNGWVISVGTVMRKQPVLALAALTAILGCSTRATYAVGIDPDALAF
ncbi:MAG: hypothetical protein DMG78_20510 [Acidobacteria bacterium]|nr:MAG: hypothetical protein DMG78_20510 [Acidobacteriota bacterium]